MENAVLEDHVKVGLTPLELFAEEIEKNGRFEIIGTTDDDKTLVLRDSTVTKGEMGSRLDISLDELNSSHEDVLSVLLDGRNPIVCNGYTRINK